MITCNKQIGAGMDKKDLIIIVSDLYIGTNAPNARYQKNVHERYLMTILNDIMACADQIREVILLGDIFELSYYHPSELPPSFDEIIEKNSDLLGPNGKLRQVLSILRGRMVYIPGDHDSNLSMADLNKIKSREGYTIKYHTGIYVPLYDSSILFTHGHESTLLNAPNLETYLRPLPIGYFLNRAMAYCGKNYDIALFASELPHLLMNLKITEFVSGLRKAICYFTGIPADMQIRIKDTLSVSFHDLETIYKYMIYDFYNKLHKLGIHKESISYHDLLLNMDKTYLPMATETNMETVVMGNKHSPSKISRNSKVNYYNTGTLCPVTLDFSKEPISYGKYSISNKCYSPIKLSDPVQDTAESPIHTVSEEETTDQVKKFTFGFSVFDASQEFWQMMQMGVLSKARELGIHIITHDQKSSTIEMLIGNLNLINRGIDALLVAPINPGGLPPIVAAASRKNIPVVALDTGTGGADVVAFIVSDSFGGGIYAGEYALTLIEKYSLQSKNTMILKVQQTAKYALLRGEGFKRVMLENGYQVVAEIPAESQENLAYEVMKNILPIYEDNLAVVFCENGTMALGAARAIDEAGKKGKIMLIGFDSGPSVIAAIKNGSIQGTIAQEPFLMGETSVEVANSVLLGIPVVYDNPREKLILMEVYLVNEEGEAVRSIQ